MLPRPRFRLPVWAALAIAVAAYVVRSVGRGFDFSLDMPADAVVLVVLLVVVALVGWLRADDVRRDAELRDQAAANASAADDDAEADAEDPEAENLPAEHS